MAVATLSRSIVTGDLFLVTYDDVIHIDELINVEGLYQMLNRMLPYNRHKPELPPELHEFACWDVASSNVTIMHPVCALMPIDTACIVSKRNSYVSLCRQFMMVCKRRGILNEDLQRRIVSLLLGDYVHWKL